MQEPWRDEPLDISKVQVSVRDEPLNFLQVQEGSRGGLLDFLKAQALLRDERLSFLTVQEALNGVGTQEAAAICVHEMQSGGMREAAPARARAPGRRRRARRSTVS